MFEYIYMQRARSITLAASSIRYYQAKAVFKREWFRWRGYAYALVALIVPIVLRLYFGSFFSEQSFFFLLLAAVIIPAWLYGLGPGLLATALATGVTYFLFLDPNLEFSLTEIPEITLFAALGVVVSLLSDWRQKREGYLQTRERTLRAVVDNNSSPLLLIDASGKITFTGASVAQIVGPPAKYFTGKQFLQIVHNDDRQNVESFFSDLTSHPTRITTGEFRLKNNGSGWLWVQAAASNYIYEDALRSIIVTLRDISTQKETDEARTQMLSGEREARRIAEDAVQARDEFLSIASHELRTPLTTILLQLQATLRSIMSQSLASFSGEKLVHSLTIAEQQSKRLQMLIKDLLNVSLISTGRLELDRKPGDLSQIVRALVVRFEEQFRHAGCQVRLYAAQPVLGEWDHIRLEQAVSNLLTNALKYGQGKPIKVAVRQTATAAQVTVSDHGIGINKPQQTVIFERFKRGSGTERFKGLGIGLFIVKQIVEAHGGTVQVESGEGQGAQFTISLPLKQGD